MSDVLRCPDCGEPFHKTPAELKACFDKHAEERSEKYWAEKPVPTAEEMAQQRAAVDAKREKEWERRRAARTFWKDATARHGVNQWEAFSKFQKIESAAQVALFADLTAALSGDASKRIPSTLGVVIHERFRTSHWLAEESARLGPEFVSTLVSTWLDVYTTQLFGSLEDRVERWVSRGMSDTRAARLARARLRRLLPWAMLRLEEHLAEGRNAHGALQRRHNLLAHQFVLGALSASGQSAEPSVMNDLARRLVVVDLEAGETGITAEQMADAAKGNKLLQLALLAQKSAPPGDPEATWMAHFAYHWPEVLKRWEADSKKARRPDFHIPAALIGGDGSPGPFFGRTKQGDTSHARSRGGSKFTVRTERRQLEILLPQEVKAQTGDEMVKKLDQILSNREFRFFVACFAAAAEDHQNGKVLPGAFLYSPTRFADMLGFAREPNGKNGETKQSNENRKHMDRALELLQRTRISGTVRVGGKERTYQADGLIVDQRGTVEERDLKATPKGATTAAARGGRRKAHFYRIADAFLSWIQDGGAFLQLHPEALRPPTGVDPRVWDDAFKVYCVLYAHARINAPTANTGTDGRRWMRLTDSLIADANTKSRKDDQGRARLRMVNTLLPALTQAGLLQTRVEGMRIWYDVDEAARARLRAIPAKFSEAAETNGRGRRKRLPRTAEGG